MVNKRKVAIDHTHEPSAPTYDGFQSKEDKALLDRLRADKVKYDNTLLTTKEPTGFTNNSTITVTYDSTTRKVTLSGTFDAYYKGVRVRELIDGWTSEAHDVAQGVYFLYYCDSGFVFSTTPWDFDCLMICFVQYNSHQIGIREVHGFMPHDVHKELHNVIGSYLVSGGDLSGYVIGSTVAAERRPLISDLVIADEDIDSTVLALSSASYTQRYLTGSAVRSFNLAQAEIVPVSGSQPYYNLNTGGTWSQALFANNSYGAIFVVGVPTTNDAGSQAYRFMFVQPQMNSASLTEIQALTPNSLVHGVSSSLVSEFVFFAKIIIRYTGGNWSITSVEKLTGTKIAQISTVAGALSTVTHDATLTGEGTITTPLSVVNDGHTHDTRYFTETEADVRFLASKGLVVTDFNSIDPTTMETGTYIIYTNGAPSNKPSSSGNYLNGILQIYNFSSKYATLTVTDSGFGYHFTRFYGATGWGTWYKMWNGSSIVSGTDLKTINGSSIIGSGDLAVVASIPDPLSVTKVRATSTTDASLTSTDHAFQTGTTAGTNVIIDDNELMARNNGAKSDFNMQIDGGNLNVLTNKTYADGDDIKIYQKRICEKGSSGGVEYTKYYDGTVEMWAAIATSSIACSTAMGAGGGFRTASQTLNLPVTLAATSSAVILVTPGDSTFYNHSGGGYVNTTSQVVWWLGSVSSDATSRVRKGMIHIIGRWY